MKAGMERSGWVVGGLALGLLAGSSAGKAAVPAANTSYREHLEQIARDLGDRWQAQVLVDPAIRPSRQPRGTSAPSLAEALDALAVPMKGVTWRRVCPASGRASRVQAEDLAAEVRMLDRISFSLLGIEHVASGRWSVFAKQRPLGFGARFGSPGARPEGEAVHLLYSTTATAEEGSLPLRMASLQRQQLATRVSDAAQPLAYARMVQVIQALPPADREIFARRTVEASLQTWASTPEEQRGQMIQQTFGLLQQLGVVGPGEGRPAAPSTSRAVVPAPAAPPAKERRCLAELRAWGTELSRRHGVPIVIDPEIFVAQPPRREVGELPAEQAIAALVNSLPGVAWRRVYLSEADRARIETPRVAEALAADVRRLELHEGESLEVEQVREQRATSYVRHRPVTARFAAEKEAAGFGKEAVYVVYSTTPSARGETAEARFADLQRQQIGLMLQMSPSQMGQAMQQLIDGYGSLDPAAQKRMLGLPLMAGMMAGWLPRQAKESQ